uniref:DEAD/DEAH box helicase n=1 Tax=Nocardiopsis lucentensis TaxID=53441 RepID=UPI00035FE878
TAQGITDRPLIQTELSETDTERARKRAEKQARQDALTTPLLEAVPTTAHDRDDHHHARATLAALVGYYQREALPPWREHYRRANAPLTDLETDTDCVVPWRVQAGEWVEPTGRQRKSRREIALRLDTAHPHPFTTGQDTHLLYPGAPGQAATTTTATVTHAEPDRLTLTETCDPDATYSRPPVAVLPGAPVNAQPKDGALELVARTAVDDLPEWPRHPGLDVLRRRPPRLTHGGPLPDPHTTGHDPIAATIAAVDALDHSYLAVQGPPGAGKTYLAAQLITHLARQGRTIGVCSTSHKAVENVMGAALAAAEAAGVDLPAAKRAKGRGKDAAEADLPWEQPANPQALARWRTQHTDQGHPVLIGGTAWAMTNAAMVADPLDVLIIDEAGQFALADTLAVSAAAHNLVLLGDPQQLPQVVQGTHGEGADASALQHLMGTDPIIDPKRGYFLDQTRRMHPAVCRTVSELSYQGRLHAHPTTTHRTLTGPEPGVYTHPVAHTGRTTHSPEEVDAVLAIATTLVGHRLTPGPDHDPRPLTGADILVVAPYNLQVRALRRALADAARHTPALDGIRVGTVDRFQGQEAAAVICSMTTSNAADTSRGPAFVLDRNRLNVALSRAQLLAAVVHSPDLLTTTPRTIDELRLLAGFTRLTKGARPWPHP